MALEQITFNIGAFNDTDASGNNYFAGEIYEVFNTNDTLADIFSDAAGANPISQDGISNKSNSNGEVVFYIDSGSYYILSGGKRRDFKNHSDFNARYNPATIQDAIDSTEWDSAGGEVFKAQGYHTAGIGAGTWRTIIAGTTPDVDLPNGVDIIQFTGVPTLAAVFQPQNATVDIKQLGAYADDTVDDTTIVDGWVTYCRANNYKMVVGGGSVVKYSNTIDLTAAPSSFTTNAPVAATIYCDGELHYTGTDKAVNFTGNLVGSTSYINTIRGAGRSSGDAIAGGGNESIGVYIGPNSGNTIYINRVTDFRNGIVLDGCYNNTVYYGSVYANDIGITYRGSASLGYGCINNTVRGNLSGGPYTSVDTTPERIDRCNRIGVWLQDKARGNTFEGNTEYSIGSAGGIGLVCDGDRNRITCYGEGQAEGMRAFLVSGNQNKLELGGGDALKADIAALKITGKDNIVSLPQNRETANTLTTFAPENGQTEYDVDETTKFTTLNQEFKRAGIPTSNWNMLSGVVFNALAPLTSVTGINDRPSEFTSARTSVEVTSTDNATRWYDSNATDVLDVSHGSKVLVSVWLKRTTNNPKISIILRDATTGEGLDSFNTALTTDGWKKIQFLADTGGATDLKLRVASRSFEVTTGYAYRVFNPYISQSLDAPEPKIVDSNYPLPTKIVNGYNHNVDVQRFDAQSSYDSFSTGTFTGNVLNAGHKPVVILTDNTGSNVINSISNMNDNSKITVVNTHTAAITFTTVLGEWPTNISLTNGRSLDIHKRGGLYYAGL